MLIVICLYKVWRRMWIQICKKKLKSCMKNKKKEDNLIKDNNKICQQDNKDVNDENVLNDNNKTFVLKRPSSSNTKNILLYIVIETVIVLIIIIIALIMNN